MNALSLYKFITDNGCEYHSTNDDDIILFVDNADLNEWKKLLGEGIMDESGIQCTMKYGYFCFMMKDICEYFGLELHEIFEKDN
ncbi:MAG: hypothetical protein AABY22_24840 [Nanoarchaeota archaeon]